MKALSKFNRRWQNKTEVKFLQAVYNLFEDAGLSVDGDYGDKTEGFTKFYQDKYKLLVNGKADGKAGPQTQRHMGFLQARNPNIVLLEIPFGRLSKAGVLLRNGQGYTCERFAREEKCDIAINGAFFEMATRKIVQLVAIKGEVQNWGMGTKGIAFPNEWSAAFGADIKDVIHKPYDLQGGAPFLIYNYKADIEGINAFKNNAIMSSKTRRNCLGVTDRAFVLMFSIANMTLYDMVNEGMYQKIKYVVGLDGGGSQSIYMGGAPVITTDGRLIPAAIGFKVKR